jgi:transporter family-2 protein
MLTVVLAVVGGVAITLQGQFMGLMDQGIGSKESVFITYGSGGILAILMIVAFRGGNLKAWSDVPWYAFTAGALGLIIVGTIGYVVPRLGLATGFTLIVATQFVVAALIDHFGFFGTPIRPLDVSKLIGLALLLVGVRLIVR